MDGHLKCENCGSGITDKIKGSSIELHCSFCDWNIVTTYIPKSISESDQYLFKVANIHKTNLNQISILSRIMNVNFAQVKGLIDEDGSIIIKQGIIEFSKSITDLISNDMIVNIPEKCKWIERYSAS